MKTSLRSFRKYVPADLVALLMASGQEAELGGERRSLTIYFSDIANFTSISESMDPEKLVDHLGEYLQVLSDQILATGGTVDKYIGDAIMAIWGAPLERPDHALAACTAALRNQQALSELCARWTKEGKPPLQARIGIHTGEAVVGNIGSSNRMNYTVIGDTVNLASRLEGLNKFYGTQILISEATYEHAKAGIVARPLDWVAVKGKQGAVLVYELLGLKGETLPAHDEMAETFAQALQAYHCRDWTEARRGFEAVLERWPEDAPAREMKRRCTVYLEEPPGADWDGVHRMEGK
jgi:adenylate cyclase